jgi:hypothetical protein
MKVLACLFSAIAILPVISAAQVAPGIPAPPVQMPSTAPSMPPIQPQLPPAAPRLPPTPPLPGVAETLDGTRADEVRRQLDNVVPGDWVLMWKSAPAQRMRGWRALTSHGRLNDVRTPRRTPDQR